MRVWVCARACVCMRVCVRVCVENLSIPLQTSTRVPMNVKRLIRVVKIIKRDKLLEVVALSMYLDSFLVVLRLLYRVQIQRISLCTC